jgi:hypothetical protein
MSEYDQLLQKIEQATKTISDETLRRIAFEQLLKHELAGHHKRNEEPEPQGPIRERVSRPARQRTRTSQVSVSSGVRESVKALGISPDEGGLPPWSSLGQLDKYLWILEAAHKKTIEGLTTTEISFLIFEIFRETHRPNQVNNLATRIRKAHVRKATFSDGSSQVTGWQILRAGKEHLQKLASGPAAEK